MRPVIFCIALFALALVRTPGDLFRDQERQGLYDWFDSLGYVSLKDAPFVRIEHWQTDGSKRSLSYSDYGFLKRGEGKSFEALTVELRDVAAVDGKPVGTDPYDDLDVVPADLQGWLAEQKRQWGTDHASRLGLGTADGFVLARLADLRGYRDLADFFYNASRTEPSYGETGMTFPQRVQEGIASSLFWDASSGFRQKALSRSDLAAEFKFIADHFPSSKRRDQASQIVAGLETMIQEDAVRKPLTDAELKKLTPAQQAAELVWQLRNQVADQYMEPGYTEVFPLGRVDGVSPAGKLVKLGPTAIPALLDALHDKRYIRACQGGMRTNRTVLRIRDAAIQVLDKIALRSFSNSPEGVMGDDDKTAALIERHAREWWATMQRLGPRKMMIRAIERGDYESASQAEVFAKSYPKDALATIRVGVAAAKDTYVRQQLIGALSTVDSPAVRAFAGEQMKAGKDLETRVAAARVVAIRDPAGAIRAMAREWANLPPSDSFSHWDIDSLRSFLTNVGYASGIETLARDLEKQPVGRRMDVVEDIDDESTWRGATPLPAHEKQLWNRAAENLLASVLQDRDQAFGYGGTFGDYAFSDPRVCDMASHQLAVSWPHKYRFTNPPSRFDRDRQCLQNLNAWRRSRGLSALPLPKQTAVSLTPDSVLDPLLVKLASGSPTEQKAARQAIEAKGIHALPRLSREAARAAAGSPGKALFYELSCGSACTLTSLTVKGFTPSSAELATFVHSFEGRPVTAEFVREVLTRVVAQWPRKTRGFTLTAVRDNDGLGLGMTVAFGAPIPSGASGGIDYCDGVTVAGKSIQGESGGATSVDYIWNDFEAAVRKALSSPPLVPIEFFISIEREPVN